MTKQEIEDKMLAAIAELRQTSADIEHWAKHWTLADYAYREDKAKAYLTSKGTIPEREALVDVACGKQRDNAHTAKALWDAAKSKQDALKTEIGGYMALAGLMRSEINLAGRYET